MIVIFHCLSFWNLFSKVSGAAREYTSHKLELKNVPPMKFVFQTSFGSKLLTGTL